MITPRGLRPTQSVLAVVLLSALILAACAPAAGSGGPTSGASAPSGGASAVAARSAPHGATAAIDAASWALADRLAAPAYTADTTAALVEGLGRSGIGTYDDPTSPDPAQPLAVLASPFHLLAFQAHALAVGAWAGSDFSGAELDTVLPIPAGSAGLPSTSELLAGYVATADSPGGNLARALMAGQDLLVPTSLQFPGVVLVLFASDIATDGGRLAAPAPSASAAAQVGSRVAGLAISLQPGRTRIEPPAAAGICTDMANWIHGATDSLFNAIKVAVPPGGVGRIIAGIWNWLVDVGRAFVQNLIKSVTDAVLGTIRSIADTIAGVAEQIASLLPQAVTVQATSDSGGGATFKLGPDPLTGTFTATVTAGDLPAWPAVLSDCAEKAGVALPDFHGKSVPLTWGPIEAPPNPLLAPTGSNPITDDYGLAHWGFVTSVDPGDPTGEQRNQFDYLPVAVHRPELDAARQRLTNILLGSIPDLLRPYVAAIFAPYLNGIQARLNALLDAHGRGAAVIVFHDQASPPPSPSAPPASPASSGGCSPNPVAPGTYKGTITNTSLETIDISNGSTIGKTVATSDATGPATVVVAADGSVSGTWSQRDHFVFDETAGVAGSLVVKEHRDEVMDITDGKIVGSACQLALGNATIKIVSCTSLLKGDCSGDAAPGGSSGGVGIPLGAPSAISPGSVTWTWHYAETGGQPDVSDTLTLKVSGP